MTELLVKHISERIIRLLNCIAIALLIAFALYIYFNHSPEPQHDDIEGIVTEE